MVKMKKVETRVRFECLPDCSACCELGSGFVFLTGQEAEAIAAHLNLSHAQFMDWFTRRVDDRLALMDGEHGHCVFLEEHRCMIYPVRPRQCRTFPFWPENMKTRRRWELTKQICPGIGQGRLYSAQEITEILNGKSLNSTKFEESEDET